MKGRFTLFYVILKLLSAGPDGIPNKLLKVAGLELAPVISDIYNTSLRQGILPQILKRSHVVSIPIVSPRKSMEEDLRPISRTAQIGKLMGSFVLLAQWFWE